MRTVGFRFVLCAMAGFAALGAGLAQGGRWSSALDVLASFAPIYLVGGLAILIIAALNTRWRERKLLVTLAGVAALGGAALMAPEALAARSPAVSLANDHGRLKVVQINLKGDGAWNSRVVDWLVAEDPDIVVLQDLGPNLRAMIGRRLNGRHLACVGDCTIALLSKRTPSRIEGRQGGHYGLTPRTILAEFSLGDERFDVVGVHLARPYLKGPSSPQSVVYVQAEQSRRLRAMLSSTEKDSLILAGDFNSTPWSFARQGEDKTLGLERRTRQLFSWPANPMGLALLPIDHIYAGSKWQTVGVARGPYVGSDHYPVVAVFVRNHPGKQGLKGREATDRRRSEDGA